MTRDIEVTIRITGDTGIPDAQVIAAVNRLLDLPAWKLGELLDLLEVCEGDDADGVITRICDRLLPPPGRWKVVPR